ncbi:MAG: sulfoxide reductase heme-binding subunit YedZ [Chloroflexi bacterium]|nr:sulfoxide reductase heme-binding subunit YedZ [Chloroflexota bacterium]
MSNRWSAALRAFVHVGALTPLAFLAWGLVSGNLTANPIEAIQLRTGKTAITLLLLSLACTPICLGFGFRPVLTLRRLLGLYAFMYASLHLINFVAVDYGFNLTLLKEDALPGKRFILAGLAAFVLLFTLAITSISGWKERLGHNWRRLHWLVYPAAILAVTHYLWQTKADFRQPLIYLGVLLLLLAFRIPIIRNRLSNRFRRGAK